MVLPPPARGTMHGGVSAASGCAFTHRVAFEEGSSSGSSQERTGESGVILFLPYSKESRTQNLSQVSQLVS